MARKPKSGNKTSLDPQRTSSTDSRARLGYGHPEFKMIRLRVLIEEHKKKFGSPLPDDCLSARARAKGLASRRQYLSARKAANDERARQTRYVLQEEIDMLWRDKVAGFERAVLEGDYHWFDRQAKAIKDGDTLSRVWFEAAVAYKLEMSSHKTRNEELKRIEAKISKHLKQKPTVSGVFWNRAWNRAREAREDVTLEPAGKRVAYTARQILNLFKTETRKDPYGRKRFYVHGPAGEEYDFERAGRADDVIKHLAKLLDYELKQPPPKKTPRHG